MNNNVSIFKYIDILPEVLLDIIYEYIPKRVSMFLTKRNYIKDHILIRNYINKKNIERYIRTMIQQDNDFVFNYLLVENYTRWLNMTRYYYKECIYANYLHFLEFFAAENDSTKCRDLILKFSEEQGLSKNQHKKKILKYIRWTT